MEKATTHNVNIKSESSDIYWALAAGEMIARELDLETPALRRTGIDVLDESCFSRGRDTDIHVANFNYSPEGDDVGSTADIADRDIKTEPEFVTLGKTGCEEEVELPLHFAQPSTSQVRDQRGHHERGTGAKKRTRAHLTEEEHKVIRAQGREAKRKWRAKQAEKLHSSDPAVLKQASSSERGYSSGSETANGADYMPSTSQRDSRRRRRPKDPAAKRAHNAEMTRRRRAMLTEEEKDVIRAREREAKRRARALQAELSLRPSLEAVDDAKELVNPLVQAVGGSSDCRHKGVNVINPGDSREEEINANNWKTHCAERTTLKQRCERGAKLKAQASLAELELKLEASCEDEELPDRETRKQKAGVDRDTKRAHNAEQARRRRARLSEEQKEIIRGRNREATRKRRSKMSETEREVMKAQWREAARIRRLAMSAKRCGAVKIKNAHLTDEQRNAVRERKRAKYAERKKNFVCSHCGRNFSGFNSMSKHEQLHTGYTERTYICEMCGGCFVNSLALLKHMKNIHSGNKSFVCPECHASFLQSKDFRMHMEAHRSRKVRFCNFCDASFGHLRDLRGHLRVHTGERPFLCKVCGLTFARRNTLLVHQRTHTGQKPYVCSQCGVGFAQSGNLRSHMHTHFGEQPYSCKHCGVSFASRKTWKVHIRTHTDEKPFFCLVCHATFQPNSSLVKHIHTNHADVNGGPVGVYDDQYVRNLLNPLATVGCMHKGVNSAVPEKELKDQVVKPIRSVKDQFYNLNLIVHAATGTVSSTAAPKHKGVSGEGLPSEVTTDKLSNDGSKAVLSSKPDTDHLLRNTSPSTEEFTNKFSTGKRDRKCAVEFAGNSSTGELAGSCGAQEFAINPSADDFAGNSCTDDFVATLVQMN